MVEALSTESPTTRSISGSSRFQRLVRRVHMYLGLFLAPWMLMYAASTVVMNHREFVQSLYPTKMPAMVRERELEYGRSFPADATREQIAELLLKDTGLEGTHGSAAAMASRSSWTGSTPLRRDA